MPRSKSVSVLDSDIYKKWAGEPFAIAAENVAALVDASSRFSRP